MSVERVFAARLAGTAVFDPLGDQVGKVRDLVVMYRATMRQPPKAIGLVVEVPGRRRVFVPMTRVTAIQPGQVITTGLVNMRRFEQRRSEVLVLNDMLDRPVVLREDGGEAVIEDVAIEQQRNRDWLLTRLFLRRATDARGPLARLRRRGETLLADWAQVDHPQRSDIEQGAAQLIAAYQDAKPADLADAMLDMAAKRRFEVAESLDDERLADVLEELPEDVQVELLSRFEPERAADVLERMQPNDAADLLDALSDEQAERLLQLMEPDEARGVRQLLSFEEGTAGGLMTTEPVILSPETSIAEALAQVRRAELHPALASAVFVTRPPLEPPTGRYLGLVHFQEMLRHPPHEAVGAFLDTEVEPLRPDADIAAVTRVLAAYNLVSVPITDEADRLIGVVTVDSVLDEMLPDDWRRNTDDVLTTGGS
ncbi:magnesium transporter MgtE N-terminal domain-containing protein [Sediminivirga luteola]|uniref:Magnesium transporter n=1 Tax=Sediminivirga luteola TaxID=1774748 RepID=A0A8J2TWH4_9MICO|nr:CBS domain-containing protein [Sediminivirga luteola]GGA07398.1 magnesium transporter [Sediminivirga luteola]